LKEATLGTWQGVVRVILVSLVCFVLGYIFPSSENVGLESFINQLSDFPLLLALFTCGCLLALISTADSAILAILHNVVSENGWRRALRLWLIGVFTFVILSYYLVFKGLKYDFTTRLFTIFSLSVISGPMILLAVFTETNILQSKRTVFSTISATSLGYVIALTCSIVGNLLEDQVLVQLGVVFGLIPPVVVCGDIQKAIY
jgi:hypothetical protein